MNLYDAIVVGSGISGGWAAKELCEKGLKTLLLERGRNVEHIKDYPSATKGPWEFAHRGKLTREDKAQYPIQMKCHIFDEVSKEFFIKDTDMPYQQVKPYDWIRGNQVGGKSLLWTRQCYRWSDLDFEANAKDGHGVDWPIRYKDIAPWYSYVERFVGISGSREGISVIPDGEFQPPMQMNCVEKHLKVRIESTFPGRKMIIGRTANLTAPIGNRGICQNRDRCHNGCPFGAYFSSNSATIPAAMATGNLTLRPHSIVMEVLYDKETRKATGVRIIDAETMKTEEFFAKVIFLNASTLGTTQILLHSTSEVFPEGLGNSSGQLGHNLMDHHWGIGAHGPVEGFEEYYYYGRRPADIYIPRFKNIEPDSKEDYLRGFAFQGHASRKRRAFAMGIGEELKTQLTEPEGWYMELHGFGECLPNYENKVTLSKTKTDKWGMPLLEMDCAYGENEKKMREDMMDSAVEMLRTIGMKKINRMDFNPPPGNCHHEMGTARMGNDPKTSVLNRWNQMHDVKNVFITDGACMSSSGNQNPSITYMALTARAVDFAVSELIKRNI